MDVIDGSITTNRKEAVDRCTNSVAFLASLFPEFTSLEQAAEELLAFLKRSEATTIGIDVTDHVEESEYFIPAVTIAVTCIESHDEKSKFAIPARTKANPVTGKTMKFKKRNYATTRDVLLYVTNLRVWTDDEFDVEMERGFLRGFIPD